MADVFISYSRRDGDFGKKLHARLAEKGRDVWMDWEDIPPTADWWAEIRQGIEEADNFVLIMSPDSIGSPVCQMEILTAIQHGKRIIPLFHRDPDTDTAFQNAVKRTQEDDIVARLLGNRDPLTLSKDNWTTIAHLNWVFFDDDDNFDEKFADLEHIIDADLEHTKDHTRLLTRALEWDEAQRHRSFLLTGDEIDMAETWLAQATGKEPAVTSLQGEYIYTSRKARQSTQRYLFGAVSAALIVALGLSVIAFTFAGRAAAAQAEAVAAQQTAIAESGKSASLLATIEVQLGAQLTQVAFNAAIEDLEPVAQPASSLNTDMLPVRARPDDDATVLIEVDAATALRVLGLVDTNDEGVWLAINLPDSRIGYVENEAVEVSGFLRPGPPPRNGDRPPGDGPPEDNDDDDDRGGPPPPRQFDLVDGVSIEDRLAPGDVKRFDFTATAGDIVRLNVEATFDSILSVRFNGEEIAFNDDDGDGDNLLDSGLVLNVPTDGEYVVRVAGYSEVDQGEFTLSVSDSSENEYQSFVTPVPTATPLPQMAAVGVIEGTLASGEVHNYAFEGEAGQQVRFDVTAAWDSVLTVEYQGQLFDVNDDDNTGDNPFDSCLETTLGVGGAYIINVSGFSAEAAGNYTLEIAPADDTC